MITQEFDWVVGCTNDPHTAPAEMIPATVPGSVQLDYANAKQYHDLALKWHGPWPLSEL